MIKHLKILRFFAIFSLFLPAAAFAGPGVGEAAPDFELVGSDGKTYSLSDFEGEKWTVIAFFPKAFTGG